MKKLLTVLLFVAAESCLVFCHYRHHPLAEQSHTVDEAELYDLADE